MLLFSSLLSPHTLGFPLVPTLLLLLLGLEVVVDTVANGTANEDDGVETDTEAGGVRRG